MAPTAVLLSLSAPAGSHGHGDRDDRVLDPSSSERNNGPHPAGALASGDRRLPAPRPGAGFRRAGWTLARVLTDRGNEFKADFAGTCATLGIRQTRIKTRHAWTNGFVERLQQTILSEHWRVVFRRHYFTSRGSLDRSLHGFMQFYNFDRPHHGYRVRGRTPATIFHGAVAAAR